MSNQNDTRERWVIAGGKRCGNRLCDAAPEMAAALRLLVAPEIELACDECGGEDSECPPDCAVRLGRAALAKAGL